MRSKKRFPFLLLVVVLTLFGFFSVGHVLRPQLADAKSDYRELELFTDVLSLVRKNYVEEVPIKDLVYGAISGMLQTLDPHSAFLPPDVYRERKIDTKGEFGGLGIEITIRDGILQVVSPIEDTPAFRAGIEAGDQILKIEDKFTKDLSIMEAVKLMRGMAGTKVTITIMRDSFDKPTPFTLTREIIKIHSVKASLLDDGYGYLRIAQFQERTAEDLHQTLEQLREENRGPLTGLVLDLRNNPGGLLDQAVKVADAFLDSGLIVYTEGRNADNQMSFSAKAEGTETDYPIVVLINGGSASASEIVSGAMQDHGRAIILGTQSFGKGSVQTLIPMKDDSGLSLTTARYFTPSGTSIQARGITPDIVVRQVEFTESKEQHFRESDLENHFEAQPGPETDHPKDAEKEQMGEEKVREDYQLSRALDLLKGWHVFRGISSKAS